MVRRLWSLGKRSPKKASEPDRRRSRRVTIPLPECQHCDGKLKASRTLANHLETVIIQARCQLPSKLLKGVQLPVDVDGLGNCYDGREEGRTALCRRFVLWTTMHSQIADNDVTPAFQLAGTPDPTSMFLSLEYNCDEVMAGRFYGPL